MKRHSFKLRSSILQNITAWTALGVVITGIICWVAYSQLAESNRAARDQNKIASETFLHNLKSDFFTPEARNLVFLIQMNALKFQIARDSSSGSVKELPIFQINVPIGFRKYTDPLLRGRSFFTENEIDDYLLNNLEDLGTLYNKHLIDSTDIYDDFSYYITVCHEDAAINDYIKWARTDSVNADFFEKFDLLYKLAHCMELNKSRRSVK